MPLGGMCSSSPWEELYVPVLLGEVYCGCWFIATGSLVEDVKVCVWNVGWRLVREETMTLRQSQDLAGQDRARRWTQTSQGPSLGPGRPRQRLGRCDEAGSDWR